MQPANNPNKPVNNSKHQRGILLIAVGVMMCILGFVSVITFAQDGAALNIAMYGATGCGGSALMGGLFLLLG